MTRFGRVVAAGGAGIVAAGTLVVAGPADPAQAKRYWVSHREVLTITGHGYGHGIGMSQYGAEGAARAGRSARQILDFYYPHTRGDRVRGRLRVLLTGDSSSAVVVRARRGLTVRDLRSGSTWRLPRDLRGSQWRITPSRGNAARSSVQYRNRHGWHRWNLPGQRTILRGDGQFSAGGKPLALVLPGGQVRRYHGALRAASPHSGAHLRDTVNLVRVDQYVRGVLPAEMPTSWSMAAVKAQAVAARTYAAWSRRANANRYWQVCDTTACQVYGGVRAETARGNTAVRQTSRRIRSWHGRPARTQFSSSSGGWTASGGRRYLPARKDPFDDWAGNTNHRWRVRVDAHRLERRFAGLGDLRYIAVNARNGHGHWGGRVRQLALRGTQGRVALTGEEMRWALALRSSWFTLEPTPIMRAWKRLGGRESLVGSPRRAETGVRSTHGLRGARQAFTDGRMFWSKRSGAGALRGAVLGKYRRLGGVRSGLGFPETSLRRTHDGGRKAAFQRGAITHRAGPGTHVLRGRILKAYRRQGFVNGRLGYPTTDIRRIDIGKRVRFQHGRITWLRRSDRIDVDIRR